MAFQPAILDTEEGKYLIYEMVTSEGEDLWYATLQQNDGGWKLDGGPQPFVQSEFRNRHGRLSPDGQYLAYRSNETGHNEKSVQPFPMGNGKWPVSSGGYTSRPLWSPEGDELFYWSDDTRALMVVPMKTDGIFRPGQPRPLFDTPVGTGLSQFNISPNGQRFIAEQMMDQDSTPTIYIVQNWYAEFEGKK